MSKQARFAFRNRQQSSQHLHGRGLAAAIGAKEAEYLSALDMEADVIDRSEIAEAPGKSLCFDGYLRGGDAWRNYEGSPARATFGRQQFYEGLFQR